MPTQCSTSRIESKIREKLEYAFMGKAEKMFFKLGVSLSFLVEFHQNASSFHQVMLELTNHFLAGIYNILVVTLSQPAYSFLQSNAQFDRN